MLLPAAGGRMPLLGLLLLLLLLCLLPTLLMPLLVLLFCGAGRICKGFALDVQKPFATTVLTPPVWGNMSPSVPGEGAPLPAGPEALPLLPLALLLVGLRSPGATRGGPAGPLSRRGKGAVPRGTSRTASRGQAGRLRARSRDEFG